MQEHHTQDHVSRRLALASLAAGGASLLIPRAVSGEDAGSAADHPIVGCWLAHVPGAPGVPAAANVTINTVDGFVVNMAPPARVSPNGVTIASGGVGVWESTGERTAHFTVVQVLSAPDGTYLGSLTIDGNPRVSDDGLSFIDDSPESGVTFRDADGNVVNVIEGARVDQPLNGTRIGPGMPGFPVASPEAAVEPARIPFRIRDTP
jgi:hypothetical protein